MAAISQFFESGLWKKVDTIAITYMARMITSPRMARGRFHFIRYTSLSQNVSFLILYPMKHKMERRALGCSQKLQILKSVHFHKSIVKF